MTKAEQNLGCGLTILAMILCCLITSCEKPDISEDSNLLKELYANSVDTLEINTDKYFLETYLYRNFMPGAFKERGLVAVVFLVHSDSTSIPSEINISKLYIIQNQTIWISTPKNSTDSFVPVFKQSKVSTEGPEWDTEINADVIVEILSTLTKEKYFLAAKNQDIERPE
jgi:hypothetical protein